MGRESTERALVAVVAEDLPREPVLAETCAVLDELRGLALGERERLHHRPNGPALLVEENVDLGVAQLSLPEHGHTSGAPDAEEVR